MISYEPLRVQLIKKNMKMVHLRKEIRMGSQASTKLNNDEPVALTILDRICTYLNCEIQDVVKHVKEER